MPRRRPTRPRSNQIRIEESANIQRCVAPLLPPARDAAKSCRDGHGDRVSGDFRGAAVCLPPGTERVELGRAVLENARRIGFGLGLSARCCGRSSGPNRPRPTSRRCRRLPSRPPMRRPTKTGQSRAAALAPRSRAVADRPLREELSELVEEDPETAANILRNWIGQVS